MSEETLSKNQLHYRKYSKHYKPADENLTQLVSDFAKQHGYHPSMSHVWISKHSFPAVRVGRYWRVTSVEKAESFLVWYKSTRQKSRWDVEARQ